MGLAPYGEPKYADIILKELTDLKEDGSFRLNMDYFNYCAGLTMTNGKFDRLFGGPRRKPESRLTQREMDLASSIQKVTEEIVMRTSLHVHKETGMKNLCLAGGVSLNCVANGKLLREGPFDDIWIQPAAGDAGGALGAALVAWYHYADKPRTPAKPDAQKGSYLGPMFSNQEILQWLKHEQIPFSTLGDEELPEKIADLISEQKVVGWHNGRMEFGPRALGARSIIGDARSPKMQSIMNLKIKFRESFRPFAPSVLQERVGDYFELNRPSPYMLLAAPVKKELRNEITPEQKKLWGIEKLNVTRSKVPAITHVDYSARIQTVSRDTNPLYYDMIKALEKKHGCATVINTSFNVRGEPIVCTPQEAFLCFMRTDMDYLLLGNCLLDKTAQKPLEKGNDRQKGFELD
jgi:carbamoyltransferase